MRWSRIKRPSPALVVSVIALVVAMGGTSYAAFSLPNNSVGNKQLKNNSVGNRKLQNGSVGNAKLRKGSVSGANIQAGAITGSNLNLGALGTVPSATHANSADSATNATNATNAASAVTASRLGGVQYVSSASITNFAMTQNFGQATCPTGLFVSGGGVFGSAGLSQSVNGSFPFSSTTANTPSDSWGAYMNNNSTTNASFTVYAICVPESNAISSFVRHAPTKTK